MIHELRLEPGPSAYRADWAITSMSPSQHLGYAVQWFALAAALLALFIYFGVHQARGSAVSTMNPTLSSGEGKRGRGRLQLLLIIGVVLGPMLLASAMYRFGFWVPESRSYDGVLIANGQDRAAIGVSATAPERRWGCWSPRRRVARPNASNWSTWPARSISAWPAKRPRRPCTGQRDGAGRSLRTAPASRIPAAATPYAGRRRLCPQPRGTRHPQLWIVDPHGNLVLRYDVGADGKAILDDLKYLLKISQIG